MTSSPVDRGTVEAVVSALRNNMEITLSSALVIANLLQSKRLLRDPAVEAERGQAAKIAQDWYGRMHAAEAELRDIRAGIEKLCEEAEFIGDEVNHDWGDWYVPLVAVSALLAESTFGGTESQSSTGAVVPTASAPKEGNWIKGEHARATERTADLPDYVKPHIHRPAESRENSNDRS